MAHKAKRSDPLSTLKKGGKTKSRQRKQPPPHLHDTDDEAGLSPQEEPDLRVVTSMLVAINTKLAAHDAKLAELAPQPTIPIDEESQKEEASVQPWRRPAKPTMGKLCTADNTVVTDVTWPHGVILTFEGKPAVYEELSTMSFVKRYLTVMDMQKQDIKKYMNFHPQDLMEDGEAYGLLVV